VSIIAGTVLTRYRQFNKKRCGRKSLKITKGGNQNPYIEEEQTTQWYGPVEMILPEPEAREISCPLVLPYPKSSLSFLILASISVTIVFIEPKTRI
jgi:hypothetical protein